MVKIVEAPTEWPDYIIFTVGVVRIIKSTRKEVMGHYGEFTKIPCIDVESKEGLIEKRPLQVAGALTLPAAGYG